MLWLFAFALTVSCELPLVALVAPRGLRRRAAVDSIAVNLCTHPLAWLAVQQLDLPWLAVEIAVLVSEVLAYHNVTRMPWLRAVLAATLANVVTASLSFAL